MVELELDFQVYQRPSQDVLLKGASIQVLIQITNPLWGYVQNAAVLNIMNARKRDKRIGKK